MPSTCRTTLEVAADEVASRASRVFAQDAKRPGSTKSPAMKELRV